MSYLLDTSIYSQPLKRYPIPSVIERWREVGDGRCRISVFCELEVLQGLEMAASARLRDLYRMVLKDRLSVIAFASAEAAVYARIQGEAARAGTTRPVIDLCIAATAITHSLTLVTLNTRDFSAIAGLTLESW
ncbi:MAG: type II toxin-antitoxin system VapC family toxin [Spirochaetaceae bacterium]|nr:MAG: type II toxin-antitoxin system VapC family toxin [Spirochaetaceae bacterium]